MVCEVKGQCVCVCVKRVLLTLWRHRSVDTWFWFRVCPQLCLKLDTHTCLSAGVMGSVEMDEFGDRQMDFAVWDMTDVESGEFQVN